MDQAIYERQVEQHNEDLHESRVNNDFTELNEEDARADRECYREIVKRMNALNLDLNLLKDKSSMEIENFLKMYDVFSDRELDRMADDDVDLEGSPYW